MPIKIPHGLPGRAVLENENIALITEEDALRQDIRPLQILLLNLMPDKITTETQLLRALGNTPLQIEITLIHPATHQSKNTSADHLDAFYKTFADIKDRNFDGLIVTGTPIAHLPYDEIHYWSELLSIFDWATTHVYRSLFLCWGAFAALHHYHNVPRHRMKQKLSGIYPHNVLKPFAPLTAGFDDILNVPVSRYSEIRTEDLKPYPHLELLVASDKAGIFLVEDTLNRRTYILNHLEYDATSLQKEYERDLETNKNPLIPYNYFPDNDPTRTPQITWRAHRTLLFSNWINMIYQGSPYNLSDLNRL